MKKMIPLLRVVCILLALILVAMGAWQFFQLVCSLPGRIVSWLRSMSLPGPEIIPTVITPKTALPGLAAPLVFSSSSPRCGRTGS